MSESIKVIKLKQAAKNKREYTLKKTKKAIEAMLANKQLINFEQVAKQAQVSKAWLYKEPSIRERIISLRTKKKTSPVPNKSQIKKYQDKIKYLENTINSLKEKLLIQKKQTEVAYGKLFTQP